MELSLLFLKFRDKNNMGEKIKNLVLWPISSSYRRRINLYLGCHFNKEQGKMRFSNHLSHLDKYNSILQ